MKAVFICLSSLPIGILSFFPLRFLRVQGAVHVETVSALLNTILHAVRGKLPNVVRHFYFTQTVNRKLY